MKKISDIAELRKTISTYRADQKTIGFVPTMGNLHEGHLSLIRKAQKHADIVIVSIFINPMQFDRAEDLENYPKTLAQDIDKLEQVGVQLLFTPTAQQIYPKGLDQQTKVHVPHLSDILEGHLRLGHFSGVATVVTKLFNLVQPDVACFGEKDFQQLAIIRQLVADLCLDIEIIAVPTFREVNGLAMSSRNGRLSMEERQRAPALARTMRWIGTQIRESNEKYAVIIEDACDQLRAADLIPDDIFIRDAQTLTEVSQHSQQVVILIAAQLGSVRLIDNLVIDLQRQNEKESAEAMKA